MDRTGRLLRACVLVLALVFAGAVPSAAVAFDADLSVFVTGLGDLGASRLGRGQAGTGRCGTKRSGADDEAVERHSGRVAAAGRKLRPGKYQLVGYASPDDGSETSSAAKANFSIVR